MSQLPPISSLLSPPEAEPFEHFDMPVASSSNTSDTYHLKDVSKVRKDGSKIFDTKVPLSPPDSPWQKHHQSTAKDQNEPPEGATVSHPDPILYPNDSGSTVDYALFGDIVDEDLQSKLVEQHMRCHYVIPKSKGTKTTRFQMPTKEEYLLMVKCVSKVRQMYNQDPGAYLKRTREEVDEDMKRAKRIRLAPVRNRTTVSLDSKAYRPPKRTDSSKKVLTQSSEPSSRKALQGVTSYQNRRDGTPAKRTPPAKKQEPPNFDFNAIPNYSPPLSTLPDHPKSLSVDWPGNALDLSADPNRHLLHEAEVHLASKLRLTCASYLCVKRRILIGRVNKFVEGKKFTKTDAQLCGRIDVNKSSRIWTAYDKVGWFDRHHFEQAITEVQQSSRCYDPKGPGMVDTVEFFGKG